MAECFCGCGRDIGFGRRALANKSARRFQREIEVLRGALGQEPPPDNAAQLKALVDRGDRLFGDWAEYIHGTRDRSDLDRPAMRALITEVLDERKRMALAEDYAGWDMLGASELFATGRRAQARLVEIDDTGVTVNNQPRAEVVLRVEPEGEEPFELRRKLLISRVNLPKVGERVEVAWDPDDRERFTFRIDDLTDDAQAGAGPAEDPLDRLKKLHELHQAGALTAEEFEREKAKLLGAGG